MQNTSRAYKDVENLFFLLQKLGTDVDTSYICVTNQDGDTFFAQKRAKVAFYDIEQVLEQLTKHTEDEYTEACQMLSEKARKDH